MGVPGPIKSKHVAYVWIEFLTMRLLFGYGQEVIMLTMNGTVLSMVGKILVSTHLPANPSCDVGYEIVSIA